MNQRLLRIELFRIESETRTESIRIEDQQTNRHVKILKIIDQELQLSSTTYTIFCFIRSLWSSRGQLNWNWFQVDFLIGLFKKGISKVSNGAWMDGCSPSASVAFQGFSLDGLIGRIKAFQTCFRPKNGQRRIVQNNQCYFLWFQTGFRLLSQAFETDFKLELKLVSDCVQIEFLQETCLLTGFLDGKNPL